MRDSDKGQDVPRRIRDKKSKNVNDFQHVLRKIHEAELAILRAIDGICRKHRIVYRIDSGTLLGAVRHRGFIPWDDDADVVFRREEFENFRRVAPQELPENMELLMPDAYQGGKAFYDFVPRIIYKNSRKTWEDEADAAFYEGKLNHLWVDLFILDRLPDSAIANKLYRVRQQIVFGLGMGHRRKLDYGKYSGLQKAEVAVLSQLGKLLPMPWIFRLQEHWARKYTDRANRTGKLGRRSFFSNYQPDFQYCVVENAWEDPVVQFPFEGEQFYGPRGWDQVLRMLYGNYQELPPEEKRVPSHGSLDVEVLDL